LYAFLISPVHATWPAHFILLHLITLTKITLYIFGHSTLSFYLKS
jgi:hypothetical protein